MGSLLIFMRRGEHLVCAYYVFIARTGTLKGLVRLLVKVLLLKGCSNVDALVEIEKRRNLDTNFYAMKPNTSKYICGQRTLLPSYSRAHLTNRVRTTAVKVHAQWMEHPTHVFWPFVPRRGCAGHGNGLPGRRRPVWQHPSSPGRTPRLKCSDVSHLYAQQGGGSGGLLHRVMCATMLI